MAFDSIYKRLGVPTRATELARGSFLLPGYEPASGVSGNPPALLPMVRTASGIIVGYWKHWFHPTRRATIVQYYGATMYGCYRIATEFARTFVQFAHIYMLQAISRSDGVTDEVLAIANALGVPDVGTLLSIYEETGDDLGSLMKLATFQIDPPHVCFDNDANYPGDFPCPGIEKSAHALVASCGYEIHSRFGHGKPDPLGYRDLVAQLPDAPPWLRSTDQAPIFDELLEAGNLSGAWMSLNSIGWAIEQAVDAMARLAAKAGNAEFSCYSEYWICQAKASVHQTY